MMFQPILLLAVLVVLASARSDKEYCGLTYTSNTYFPTAAQYKVISTVLDVGVSQRSHLLAFDSSIGEVILSLVEDTGIVERDRKTVAKGFCVGGLLFSADVTGDGRDDLLCKKAGTNTFSFKPYTLRHKYGNEEDMDSSFVCDMTVPSKILIGDFDGNKADDIMCLDASIPAVGPTSSIYFNSACPKSKKRPHGHYHHGGHFYKSSHMHAHARQHNIDLHHKLCPINLPSLYVFPAASLVNFDAAVDTIVVADSNGDGRDDLVITDGASVGEITFFLSTGAVAGSVFANEVTPAAAPECDFTSALTILAADVDGDGDDDIVCANLDSSASANDVSFFTAGDYDAMTAPTGTACNDVCDDGGTDPVEYAVGDFNGDGADDYMCRWGAGGYTTGMFFAVPKP